MAAESVVNFLMRMIDSLHIGDAGEGKLLKEVYKIRDKLEIMRGLLRDADARADTEEVVKIWLRQVGEAAYDIEDVIDEFELFQAQKGDHSGSKYREIQRLADQMRELGNRVEDISTRRERYRFNTTDEGSISNTLDNKVNDLRSLARFSKEDDLVGIDNPRNELIKWLVEGDSRLAKIAVAGMGGLGKTTLAGKVYYTERVKAHFECRAWVAVSQSFKVEDILRSMVKELCESSMARVDNMDTGKLVETLQEFLQQKRYLIVLDDVWKIDDWQRIIISLPDGKMGSRIMVTTRINEVAAYCAENSHIYNLHPLSFDDGWTLFCRKAFRWEFGGSCPSDLKELSKKIVKKCGGLPLAIVAIGSLLSIKSKTPMEWQNVYNRLGYQIESNPSLNSMNTILSLSINDLPYHLKSCLFYLCIFPEDYLIKRTRLIRLWIAEGFVGRNEGMTLEDVADDYFQELIGRSLIQVSERTDYGKVHGCRVHDIIREMILLKSREGNFAAPLLKDSMEQSNNIRRVSINCIRKTVQMDPESICSLCTDGSDLKNDGLFSLLPSNLRSLIIFSTSSVANLPFSKLRYLRVLDFEGGGSAIRSFPSEILCLLLLRFLSFRGTGITMLPPAIASLRNLQTLDLRNTFIKELPADIFELKHLRHLLASYRIVLPIRRRGVKVGDEVVRSLKSLQELAYIDAEESRGVIREVWMLSQLRKLGIRCLPTEYGIHLCASIDKMKCLHKLHVSSTSYGRNLLKLEFVSSPPPLLQHLRLDGYLEKLPHWIPSLSNLVRLILRNSALKEDPFKALQHLSNLMILDLDKAYEGNELCCESGGFQSLNSLSLSHLQNLEKVKLEQGAMPSLQKLKFLDCPNLERVPLGIEHLTQIKELQLIDMPHELLRSISSNEGEDHWKISHIPIRRLYFICTKDFKG